MEFLGIFGNCESMTPGELLGIPRNSKLFRDMKIILNPRPWNFWEYLGIVKSMTGNYWEFLGTQITSQTFFKEFLGLAKTTEILLEIYVH